MSNSNNERVTAFYTMIDSPKCSKCHTSVSPKFYRVSPSGESAFIVCETCLDYLPYDIQEMRVRNDNTILPIFRPLPLGEPTPAKDRKLVAMETGEKQLQNMIDTLSDMFDDKPVDETILQPKSKAQPHITKSTFVTPEQICHKKIVDLLLHKQDHFIYYQGRTNRFDCFFGQGGIKVIVQGVDKITPIMWVELLDAFDNNKFDIEPLQKTIKVDSQPIELKPAKHEIKVTEFKDKSGKVQYRQCKCGQWSYHVVRVDNNKPTVMCNVCLDKIKAL